MKIERELLKKLLPDRKLDRQFAGEIILAIEEREAKISRRLFLGISLGLFVLLNLFILIRDLVDTGGLEMTILTFKMSVSQGVWVLVQFLPRLMTGIFIAAVLLFFGAVFIPLG